MWAYLGAILRKSVGKCLSGSNLRKYCTICTVCKLFILQSLQYNIKYNQIFRIFTAKND